MKEVTVWFDQSEATLQDVLGMTYWDMFQVISEDTLMDNIVPTVSS